jgi:3-dehydroquinate synthase
LRTLVVRHSTAEYPVVIGSALADSVAGWLRAKKMGPRVVLVSHPELYELFEPQLLTAVSKAGLEVTKISVPSGEQHKSLEEAGLLYEALSGSLVERRTPLLALGGGVIGDLAGFAASTYMRGIPLVHMPTSLLAQVDSSIGGKTAVNHGELKNQIGTFYPPLAVFTDIDLLKTLPQEEIGNGLAEMIKSAVIANPKLFIFLERNIEAVKTTECKVIEEAVYQAASVKAMIVSRDEKEKGPREVLNLGHTIGHAIESVSGFGISHGHAIAAGMVAAARIAYRMGMFAKRDLDRLIHLVRIAGLPVELPVADPLALLAVIKHDKKVLHGAVRMVLPLRLGRVAVRAVEPLLIAEVVGGNEAT